MKKIAHILYITLSICLLISIFILINQATRLNAIIDSKTKEIVQLTEMDLQMRQSVSGSDTEIADLHSALDKDAAEIANLQKSNKQLSEKIAGYQSEIADLKEIPINEIIIDSNLDPQVVFQVLKYFKAIEEDDADAFLATTLGSDPNDFYLWEIHIKEGRSFKLSGISLMNQVTDNLIEIDVDFHNPENRHGVYTQSATLAALKKDGIWWLHDGS